MRLPQSKQGFVKQAVTKFRKMNKKDYIKLGQYSVILFFLFVMGTKYVLPKFDGYNKIKNDYIDALNDYKRLERLMVTVNSLEKQKDELEKHVDSMVKGKTTYQSGRLVETMGQEAKNANTKLNTLEFKDRRIIEKYEEIPVEIVSQGSFLDQVKFVKQVEQYDPDATRRGFHVNPAYRPLDTGLIDPTKSKTSGTSQQNDEPLFLWVDKTGTQRTRKIEMIDDVTGRYKPEYRDVEVRLGLAFYRPMDEAIVKAVHGPFETTIGRVDPTKPVVIAPPNVPESQGNNALVGGVRQPTTSTTNSNSSIYKPVPTQPQVLAPVPQQTNGQTTTTFSAGKVGESVVNPASVEVTAPSTVQNIR